MVGMGLEVHESKPGQPAQRVVFDPLYMLDQGILVLHNHAHWGRGAGDIGHRLLRCYLLCHTESKTGDYRFRRCDPGPKSEDGWSRLRRCGLKPFAGRRRRAMER